MAFCEYCGAKIESGWTVCGNCGAPFTVEEPVVTAAAANESGDYQVILSSLSSCTKAAASDLLEDILGYTESQANEMFAVLPAIAAQNLSYQQAQYVAQAMTEYGMEVVIKDKNGYVDTDDSFLGSIFNSDGSLLSKAASIFGMLTGLNRMKKFRRWSGEGYGDYIFRRNRPPMKKPVHVRRRVRPAEPQPVQYRAEPKPAQHVQHQVQHKAPQNPYSFGGGRVKPGGTFGKPSGGGRPSGGGSMGGGRPSGGNHPSGGSHPSGGGRPSGGGQPGGRR